MRALIIGIVLFSLSAGPALQARAADEADPPKPAGPPKLAVESADGGSSIAFHLAAQFLWSYLYRDNGPDADRSSESKLLFRRLRPVAQGSVFTRDLTWLLHLSVAPGALELMDLWVDYKLHPQLQVRLGQMKIPFTRYRLNSFKDLPVTDWTYPTQYFGAERQLGFTLHNNMGTPPPLEYELGVFTGVNARAANGMAMPRVYGEKFSSPSSLVDPAPYDHLHTEIVAHFAYNQDGMQVRRPADLEGGPPRVAAGLSAAWDLDPRPLYDMRLRLAPELTFKAHGFSIGGVFFFGLFDELSSNGTYAPGLLGGVLQTSYVFADIYEVALRYGQVTILSRLRKDARRRADALIGAAGTQEDADALTEKYAAVGGLEAEHEVALGFNVYLFDTTLKWQTDLVLQIHQGTERDLRDLRLRSMLQLAF